MPEPTPFDLRTRAEAVALRANDQPPKTAEEWAGRRKVLLAKMKEACGPIPEKPCDLTPKIHGELKRDGYTIQKITYQTRPDVWVTASAYVPTVAANTKVPAVLVVHGHWAWARRDPVVQSRSIGLAKLGFFVLAVDAFGAGERHTKPARGTYHGGLMGATLWPTGHSLLGMQVYDNQRAVDYILSRPEVNGKLGITGASGGGNQSMNSGALDDRFQAVVPVCSVGSYQAYLKAACCVCEVLPNALTFTDEGDVLGLVAPRALMVINAAKDAVQFSPKEAEPTIARAKNIYELLKQPTKIKHLTIDSGHDYNQAMREAMYGWMSAHLKGVGNAEPIPEPKMTIETPEDLAIFPNPDDRPKTFLFPQTYAAVVSKELVKTADSLKPNHAEMWNARAATLRIELDKLLRCNQFPAYTRIKTLNEKTEGGYVSTEGELEVDRGLTIPVTHLLPKDKAPTRINVIIHPDGQAAVLKLPLLEMLKKRGEAIYTADLRGLGVSKPTWGAVAGAADHTIAEHGIWIGQPLLGQWTIDLNTVRLNAQLASPQVPTRIIAYGQLGIVATIANGAEQYSQASLHLIDMPTTYVTDTPYGSGTLMGLLAPGILKIGDIPHFLALNAPKKLVIEGSISMQGNRLDEMALLKSLEYTSHVYKTVPNSKLIISADGKNPALWQD